MSNAGDQSIILCREKTLILLGAIVAMVFVWSSVKPFDRLTWFLEVFPVIGAVGILGYTYYPTEIAMDGSISVEVEEQTGVLNHWFVDGWFPVFPWVGFALLGVLLERQRTEQKTGSKDKTRLITGVIALVIGIAYWFFKPGDLLSREGFSELFYPPGYGYLITALGLLFVFVWAFASIVGAGTFTWLRWLGQASLFMYIFHIFVIARIFTEKYEEISFDFFLKLYVLLMIGMIFLGWVLRMVRRAFPKLPFPVRFLIGG